jgi:hypothetical protein
MIGQFDLAKINLVKNPSDWMKKQYIYRSDENFKPKNTFRLKKSNQKTFSG